MPRTGWLILLALVFPAVWGYAVHRVLLLVWRERMRPRRGDAASPTAGPALDPWDYQI